MANAFVVQSLAVLLVSANFSLTAVWTIDWVLFHSRLTPIDDLCLHQGGVYGDGNVLIEPYLALWSSGMLVGSSEPVGLCPPSD